MMKSHSLLLFLILATDHSCDIIENRVYFVTFLSGNGLEDPTWNNKWIMEKALNQLITHKNKTKKYVYDETALKSSVLEKKNVMKISPCKIISYASLTGSTGKPKVSCNSH